MEKGPFEKKYRALLRQEPRAYESTFYNLFDRSSVYRPNDGLPRGVYNPKPSIFADSPEESLLRKKAEASQFLKNQSALELRKKAETLQFLKNQSALETSNSRARDSHRS